MRTLEILKRLDALPILVTLLGVYWLTATLTIWAFPSPRNVPDSALDAPLENAPGETSEPEQSEYLILSEVSALLRQSYVDVSEEVERVSIEDFTLIDTGMWAVLEEAARQDILERSGLLSDPEFVDRMYASSITSADDILSDVNHALARQLPVFEVVQNADGEKFVFTGQDFIRWQPGQRFAVIPIGAIPEIDCEVDPGDPLCQQ
ncbi:hypothetical protein [Shimia sp. MMG029]|uniref:hypothetical protein n=1 Tax=Shimia sp. MMG029 TaxID=3021978 RepID=UPI0022FDBFEA|nr:hypothetical protein [Shimia sp. MMG029]MDA5556582.1 hypothetical protein [Shimia sp. MMG029]